MIKLRQGPCRPRRRAMILMVVLALLTLFALVGISFVLVANSQESASRLAREAETQFRPQIDPEAALAYFLGQMVYDVNDPIKDPNNPTNVLYRESSDSALRGQSLARNMYGWYHDATSPSIQQLNDKPYSGTGRLHGAVMPPLLTGTGTQVWNFDPFVMNYQWYQADGFLRDPERPIFTGTNYRTNPLDPLPPYTGGFAVPYTYPDHNNFYLAHIDSLSGQVSMPSFHRSYLFGRLDLPAVPPGGQPAQPGVNYNPNWNEPKAKYLTLRPTRAHHPKFPMPIDAGGDVKQLDGLPGGCDSLWTDIGSPVMIAPDGTKYKMLVAPLILELDSRINLNVVGNWLGQGAGGKEHRSNQGWGPWEINPMYVLDANNTEWLNVFQGSSASGLARIRGRYDNDANPRGIVSSVTLGSVRPRYWALANYNGKKGGAAPGGTGATAEPFTLPKFGATSFYTFPTFPDTTYGYLAGAADVAELPLHYNTIRPQAPNRQFPLTAMVKLLREGGSGSDMLSNELTRLLPANLVTGANAFRRRSTITTLSADLDRPGATPWLWDPADPMSRYILNPGANGVPTTQGNASVAFPDLALRGGAVPSGSEFDGNTWRSGALARLGRMAVNRSLPEYSAGHAVATQARQKFAQELFDRLRLVTGGMQPADAFTIAPVGKSDAYKALRYLAQLAVNIVDFVDADDVSTPFPWHSPGGANPPDIVFGFELPRAVINETYVQFDNEENSLEPDPMNLANMRVKATANYNVNVWAELMNPMPAEPQGMGTSPDCTAKLVTGGMMSTPIYRLLLIDSADVAAVRDPANTRGDPDFNLGGMPSRIKAKCEDWGQGAMVPSTIEPQPLNNRFNDPTKKNIGFFVIAPKVQYLAAQDNPGLSPPETSAESTGMTYTLPANSLANQNTPTRPVLLLQRLANPNMPHDPNALDMMGNPNANYNPFVTTDMVEHVAAEVMDGRRYDTNGPRMNVPGMATRTSFGRRQPLAGWTGAGSSERRAQAPTTPVANKPQHTFFRQNCVADDAATLAGYSAMTPPPGNETIKVPFDWFVHLDRQLISPVELLFTSPHRPFDVLNHFVVNSTSQRHLAPWKEGSARLYRFLEFASTTTGVGGFWGTTGGRVLGKVNINNVWHKEVLKAMADAQGGNAFTQAEVDALFDRIRQYRSGAANATTPGPTDQKLATLSGQALHRPFTSLAMGYTTGPTADALYNSDAQGRGLDSSVLQTPGGMTDPLFDIVKTGMGVQPEDNHFYRRKELLTKVFNSMTTRSNCFAVWMTVGFFKVEDDTVKPPRLGEEIGKAENRHIRYRTFAIVDRTHLKAFSSTSQVNFPAMFNAGDELPLVMPWTNTIAGPPARYMIKDSRTDREWEIKDGTHLTFEPNTENEETVLVKQNATTGALSAVFSRTHPNNCRVDCRANPGPWARYDPRKDTDVVPFFMLVD